MRPPRWRLLPHLFFLWRYKLTPGGRYLFYGMVLAGLGSVSVLVPVYQVFCGLAGLLLVCWLTGLAFRPKLSVRGQPPVKAAVGVPITVELTITNRSRRPVFDLMLVCLDLPPTFKQLGANQTIPRLGDRQTVTMPLVLQPSRRGLYDLKGVHVHSTFPFNIVRSGSTRHELGTILVLPSFHPVARLDIPAGTRYQPGGIALTSNVGESPEYIGNREYVPGEPARRLDFRSWARLGKPIVREYQEEYYCRIALVLDTFILRGPPWRLARRPHDGVLYFPGFESEGQPRLDAAVSLAATIADALAGGEYIVDLFAAGPELYIFRSGRHTAHLENVLEILACVDACHSDPMEAITPAIADELGNISTVICLFLDWDEPRRHLAQTILESGCSLKMLMIRDMWTDTPLDEAGMPEFLELTVDQIREGGIEVL